MLTFGGSKLRPRQATPPRLAWLSRNTLPDFPTRHAKAQPNGGRQSAEHDSPRQVAPSCHFGVPLFRSSWRRVGSPSRRERIFGPGGVGSRTDVRDLLFLWR